MHKRKTDLFEQISGEIIPFTHFILILVLCSIRKVVLIKPLTKSVRLQRRMSGLYATKHTYFKKIYWDSTSNAQVLGEIFANGQQWI